MSFEITTLSAGGGALGICPCPGKFGQYAQDFDQIREWQPSLVLSMTETQEFTRVGADTFPQDLSNAGIDWRHLPIVDFGAPNAAIVAKWLEVSPYAKKTLSDGGRVLVHCMGGCGRSGMVLLRLMVELGESPEIALKRLRAVRPCAVETEGQYAWASEVWG
ncbi:phosphatase domain-containing putative toxin [Cochlodiniinecator piscidefendens]|uniref:phosphatase domain-containing putative toxin n=1 Tax=Cochlodiniinecator piscidefendens TaxID=2715756 RepID=UPI00140E82E4|nr:protein-tyrosine phosphatase family protein [Cochlodiniinecator piscidefendens]